MYKYFILSAFAQIAISSYAPYIQIALRNKGGLAIATKRRD